MVFKNYPAMKIVTISTNAEYTKFLAGLFNGSNYGHFCFPSLKGKILVDLVSKDIPELRRRYAAYTYKEEVESNAEILEENKERFIVAFQWGYFDFNFSESENGWVDILYFDFKQIE